ncbi:MAG: VCBS repeat-containing protein [Candidatus Hydrogenedentes bacterium]|nr:VCBS repeat-containing protein [Candidatus Hydrogenedentota bacterium]
MVSIIATVLVLGAQPAVPPDELLTLAPGWTATVVATVDQSYVGWDVEIGDADNDGKNEILTTGCPDSRLYLFEKSDTGWETRLLAENLAERKPGMGLAVRVADLNRDGANEVVLGTGQEGEGTAFLYVFRTDGMTVTPLAVSRPDCNKSGFTHNLAFRDLDKDGVDEIVSAYCSGGEIVRYDLDPALSRIDARLLHTLSGSGEEALIADVDNDSAVEFITSNSFREGRARVEIFEFNPEGELVLPPRIALEGFEGNSCFYASIAVGDVDNDGANEMIVGWKREQKVNKATLVGYRVGDAAEPAYTFERETEDLDMGYFEKMMAIADADNDGKNELVVSTRGDNMSELIASQHLGHVFRYTVDANGAVARELLANLDDRYAESSWLAVGDADNDGLNEVVLATGKGDRTLPGTSYVVMLKR